jgi:hypothetical protein
VFLALPSTIALPACQFTESRLLLSPVDASSKLSANRRVQCPRLTNSLPVMKRDSRGIVESCSGCSGIGSVAQSHCCRVICARFTNAHDTSIIHVTPKYWEVK